MQCTNTTPCTAGTHAVHRHCICVLLGSVQCLVAVLWCWPCAVHGGSSAVLALCTVQSHHCAGFGDPHTYFGELCEILGSSACFWMSPCAFAGPHVGFGELCISFGDPCAGVEDLFMFLGSSVRFWGA